MRSAAPLAAFAMCAGETAKRVAVACPTPSCSKRDAQGLQAPSRPVEGYDASSRLRNAGVPDFYTERRIAVEIVDRDDRLSALVEGVLVTRARVTVLKYAHGRTDRG